MSSIARAVFAWAILGLPAALVGCSGAEGNGNGGSGGTAASGGTKGSTVDELCRRLDDCNELVGISASECADLTNFCLDESFPTSSLKADWAKLVEECQEFSTCAVFSACYAELPCSLDGGGTGGAGGVGGGTGGVGGTGGSGGNGTGGSAGNGDGGVGGSGGCSGEEITCYPDGDSDNWPRATGAITACDTCPGDFVPARPDVDCDDGNADVFPGNEMFYFDCRPCGMQCCVGDDRFDYNCDGESELQYPNETTCPCPGNSGFLGQIPDCGVEGDFHRCRTIGMLCEVANFVSRQPCR